MTNYRHFKGEIYQRILEAEHSETGEVMVVYQNETGSKFVRPASLFYGKVKVNGVEINRFSKIETP